MSLILDALKKSEAERQRGQVPHLLSPLPTAAHHAKAGKRNPWPKLLLYVLPILLIACVYFYLDTADTPVAKTETVTERPIPVETAKPVAAPLSVAEPAPVISAPQSMPVEKTAPPLAASALPPASTPTPVETPVPASEPEPAARIASLSEMSNEQRQQLPALKLSMHVYSSDSAKRFAIIDGQRVNEGSVLGPAVVEQIRQDGVVLSMQGQSYLLPRP